MYLNKAKMIALLTDIENLAKEAKAGLAEPAYRPIKPASEMYVKIQALQELANPTQPNPYDEANP